MKQTLMTSPVFVKQAKIYRLSIEVEYNIVIMALNTPTAQPTRFVLKKQILSFDHQSIEEKELKVFLVDDLTPDNYFAMIWEDFKLNLDKCLENSQVGIKYAQEALEKALV